MSAVSSMSPAEYGDAGLRSAAGLLALQTLPGTGEQGALHIALLAAEADPSEEHLREVWSRELVEAEQEIGHCREAGIAVLSIFDADYPDRVRTIPNPPPVLYVKGDIEALRSERAVAFAGSREAGEAALATTAEIVAVIGGSGWAVLAGLGKGVDTAAHRAALEVGTPTVAVMPGGLDHIIPAPNRVLAEEIVDSGGAVISPYRMALKAGRATGIVRNRITTALARALVMTAASDEDGAMYAVADAAGQGRPVLVGDPPEGGDGEGLRTLLASPAGELHERLEAWRGRSVLAAGLGYRPLAVQVSPQEPERLLARLEGTPVPEAEPVDPRTWWPGLD